MKILSRKNSLNGNISIPGSKSHTIRAVIFAAFTDKASVIRNPLCSDDCLTAVKIIKQLGAQVLMEDGQWLIAGRKEIFYTKDIIDVGNSGSLLYFLPPILASFRGRFSFTGDKSVQNRPVEHMLEALEQVGVKVIRKNEVPELTDEDKVLRGTDLDIVCSKIPEKIPMFTVIGQYKGKSKDKIITEGSLSQYVSGFMMAAHRLRNGLKIHLTNPKETPYLDMTKKWLRYQNIKCKITPDYSYIRVMHAEEKSMINVTIPADWESVAFPLIASLITKSDVTINGVSYSSGLFAQGDSEIVGILWSVGANLQLNYDEQTLHIRGGERLSTDNLPDKILHINISSMPDEICALSVIACFIDGTTIFHDVEICRKKETDRVYAMCTELSKLGFDIKESDDKKDLIVHGKFPEDLVDKSRSEIVRKIKEDLEKKMVDTNLFFTTGTDLVEKNNQKFTTGTDLVDLDLVDLDLVDLDEKIPEKYSNVSSVKTSYPIVLESYKDHRVAMALACAGLGLKEGESVIINDAECCSISFPGFYELMNKLGAGFEEV